MKLNDFMRGAYPKGFNGEIGIEIETETAKAYEHPEFSYWGVHTDGSLRNYGVEYVLAQPLDYNSSHYKAALDEFAKFASKIKWLPSVYTSVHVHFNVKDFELSRIGTFITLYLLFEEQLSRYCGPDRDGNLFCLKTRAAERNYQQMVSLFQTIEKSGDSRCVRSLNQSVLKYAGLNIAPLRIFGSLEVRTHGGTTDVEEIHRWVSILYRIYDASKNFSTPRSVFASLRRLGNSSFTDSIFGDYRKYLDTSRLQADFDATMWYALSVADSVEDWENLGVIKEKKKKEQILFKGSDVNPFFTDEDLVAGSTSHDLAHYFSGGASLVFPTQDT